MRIQMQVRMQILWATEMQISIIAQVQPFVNLGCRFRVRPGADSTRVQVRAGVVWGADAWPCVEAPGIPPGYPPGIPTGYPPGIPAAPPYPFAIDESGQGRVLVPESAIVEKIWGLWRNLEFRAGAEEIPCPSRKSSSFQIGHGDPRELLSPGRNLSQINDLENPNEIRHLAPVPFFRVEGSV